MKLVSWMHPSSFIATFMAPTVTLQGGESTDRPRSKQWRRHT